MGVGSSGVNLLKKLWDKILLAISDLTYPEYTGGYCVFRRHLNSRSMKYVCSARQLYIATILNGVWRDGLPMRKKFAHRG